MKQHMLRALALGAALAATSGAATAIGNPISFSSGHCISLTGEKFGCYELGGTAELEFSELLLGWENISLTRTMAIAPALLEEDFVNYTSTLKAPIKALHGTWNSGDGSFTPQAVSIAGGATLNTSSRLPNGKRNSSSTGGSLTLTNITIDLAHQSVYADLAGANGVGFHANQLIWRHSAMDGATTFALDPGYLRHPITLSSLNITDEALQLFGRSLGLTDFGMRSMAGIIDYGQVHLNATLFYNMEGIPTPVPEPSSYMMVIGGLAGLAASRAFRRRQA